MEAPPRDELWYGKSRRVITLTDRGLSELPEKPSCPALEELFLQNNPDLTEIPSPFFRAMPQLHILDLSNTSIKSLPKSISHLVRLKKLLLRSCELLTELPPQIGGLFNLEMLDLEGTELICLPKEIKRLLQLKRLNVSFYESADQYKGFIPRSTLSRLSLLEELSINVNQECGSYWEAELKAVIEELATLGNLKRLKLFFPTVEPLQEFLKFPCRRERDWCPNTRLVYQTLRSFRLTVGHDEERVMSCLPAGLQAEFEKLVKCLKYVNGEGITDGIGKVLEYSNAFFLDRHWTIESLSVFKADQMRQLQFCLLVQCNEMKTIVDEGDLDPNGKKTKGLESLRYLSIHWMKNLESIWKGPNVKGWMSCLKVLALHTCPKLSTIFNIGLLHNLICLKELIVEECRQVQSLVKMESSHSEYDDHSEFLPSLERISLLHLPELVSIFNGLNIARRLEKMVVYNCPKLRNLSPVASKSMKEIKGEIKWWEELEWQSNRVHSKLVCVFVPLARDGDLIDQLEEARSSINNLSMPKTSLKTQTVSRSAVTPASAKTKAMKTRFLAPAPAPPPPPPPPPPRKKTVKELTTEKLKVKDSDHDTRDGDLIDQVEEARSSSNNLSMPKTSLKTQRVSRSAVTLASAKTKAMKTRFLAPAPPPPPPRRKTERFNTRKVDCEGWRP
ncbi:hypothetical protein LguiB_006641 [Lonicera macranthoides]